VEKIHRATIQNYKATWTSLLTNEKAKSTITRWLHPNRPVAWALPIINFSFLDGDFPLALSYSVYISQLVGFTGICDNVSDFNESNLVIKEKLLHQGYCFHKLLKTFTKFYYHVKTNAFKETILFQPFKFKTIIL
jgi:hypothetical protein